MALSAALLAPLALATAQQPGPSPFTCELPEGYSAFAPVADRSETWEALATSGDARFLVQRFTLEGSGARAAAVLRELRKDAWGNAALVADQITFEPWSGEWGGVPETAGHAVRYAYGGKSLAAVERVAVLGDQLVHFLWDGPETRLAEGVAAAASFRIPDAWIPPPLPDRDLHRGVAPGSEARALPWSLELRMDFVSRRAEGELEIAVRALPATEGGTIPPRASWRLPAGAENLGFGDDGFLRYRLPPSGDPLQPLLAWGLRYSLQGDLAALDAAWLAVPEAPPGRWLPPAWSLEAHHAGHVKLLGPTPWTSTQELGERGAITRIGPVPAGLCWPAFVSGRFQPRQQAGLTWQLRLDAKAIVPDDAVATLRKLVETADRWLGVPADRAWSVVSFPGTGDRALPGLFVLDEDREWFAKPADGRLGTLGRRAWLARLVASSRFGARARGSGNAAPVLESALAEYAAARLLDEAGFAADAAALRESWQAAEASAGALPTPLALMPAEEVYASGRLLTAGARFWTALEALAGRERLDAALRTFAGADAPWTTQQLERTLAGDSAERAAALRAFFDAHLYGIRKP